PVYHPAQLAAASSGTNNWGGLHLSSSGSPAAPGSANLSIRPKSSTDGFHLDHGLQSLQPFQGNASALQTPPSGPVALTLPSNSFYTPPASTGFRSPSSVSSPTPPPTRSPGSSSTSSSPVSTVDAADSVTIALADSNVPTSIGGSLVGNAASVQLTTGNSHY